eukprot:COSAG04_NODE_26341_length_296_cov_0.482234_1_plen_42_part_01
MAKRRAKGQRGSSLWWLALLGGGVLAFLCWPPAQQSGSSRSA